MTFVIAAYLLTATASPNPPVATKFQSVDEFAFTKPRKEQRGIRVKLDLDTALPHTGDTMVRFSLTASAAENTGYRVVAMRAIRHKEKNRHKLNVYRVAPSGENSFCDGGASFVVPNVHPGDRLGVELLLWPTSVVSNQRDVIVALRNEQESQLRVSHKFEIVQKPRSKPIPLASRNLLQGERN